MRKTDPWRREIRPERYDQEHRKALKAIDNLIEELPGCRIEPVRILEHDQYRPPGGEPFELREKCPE